MMLNPIKTGFPAEPGVSEPISSGPQAGPSSALSSSNGHISSEGSIAPSALPALHPPTTPVTPLGPDAEDTWAPLLQTLSQPQTGLAGLLSSLPTRSENAPPMPPHVAEKLASRLPGILHLQCQSWAEHAYANEPARLDPSTALGSLAFVVRFLGHAQSCDAVVMLGAIRDTLENLSHSGLSVNGRAASQLGFGLSRLRSTGHDPALRSVAGAVLNAMAPHLAQAGGLNDRCLSGLVAALAHQRDPDAVKTYLHVLAQKFERPSQSSRFSSLFVRAGLPGLTDLAPCEAVDTIMSAVASRLADNINIEADGQSANLATAYFLASAVIDIGPHLGGQAGRTLACQLVAKSAPNMALPRQCFANAAATEDWLAGILALGSAATLERLDLHRMGHRLAGFCVDRVIRHLFTHSTGTTRMEIVFGSGSHLCANKGAMLAVASAVIDTLREGHADRIDAPQVFQTRLVVNVRGRQPFRASVDEARNSAASSSARSTNSFEALLDITERGELPSGSRRASRKRNRARKSSGPETASARGVSTAIRAAPVGDSIPRASSPAASATGGWLPLIKGFLGGWFRN